MPEVLAYVTAFLAGLFTGLIEVVTRYRDAPFRAAWSPWGLFYLALNAFLGLLAYLIVHHFKQDELPEDVLPLLGLAAASGFGAMAVLRARVFTVRMGEADVGFGPGAAVDKFLAVIDREIGRRRARERRGLVRELIPGMAVDDLLRAARQVPKLRPLTATEQQQLDQALKDAGDPEQGPAEERAGNLGIALLDLEGEDGLRQIAADLRARAEAELEPGERVALVLAGLSADEVRAGFGRLDVQAGLDDSHRAELDAQLEGITARATDEDDRNLALAEVALRLARGDHDVVLENFQEPA